MTQRTVATPCGQVTLTPGSPLETLRRRCPAHGELYGFAIDGERVIVTMLEWPEQMLEQWPEDRRGNGCIHHGDRRPALRGTVHLLRLSHAGAGMTMLIKTIRRHFEPMTLLAMCPVCHRFRYAEIGPDPNPVNVGRITEIMEPHRKGLRRCAGTGMDADPL